MKQVTEFITQNINLVDKENIETTDNPMLFPIRCEHEVTINILYHDNHLLTIEQRTPLKDKELIYTVSIPYSENLVREINTILNKSLNNKHLPVGVIGDIMFYCKENNIDYIHEKL